MQQKCFASDIIRLKNTITVPSKSKVIGLLQSLGCVGIMSGIERLPKDDVEYQTKHATSLHN